MKQLRVFIVTALLAGTSVALQAQDGPRRGTVVVTASNAAANQLLVYDPSGNLLQTVPTQGQGGVGGNAGGIAVNDGLVAVVNYNSKSVSILVREGQGFKVRQVIPAASKPVSVAFGNDHLYILGTTIVESHRLFGPNVGTNPDGVVTLLKADGTAAQVGIVTGQLVITEKSNAVETVNLLPDGSVAGTAAPVMNLPANVDTPFGLVTRGDNAYVTLAHADETVLVRKGAVLTVTGSGSQHSPCWLALVGPFLYSSNSPSHSVSRYAVYGRKIIQDAAVAASFNGSPTDIASGGGYVAVVDGAGGVSHISVFSVDEDGNLALTGSASVNAPANGIAVVQ